MSKLNVYSKMNHKDSDLKLQNIPLGNVAATYRSIDQNFSLLKPYFNVSFQCLQRRESYEQMVSA